MEIQQSIETDARLMYLVLKEHTGKCNGAPQTFDAELIDEEKFISFKNSNFKSLSDWALKNNSRVLIIEAYQPLIKITPNVTVFIKNQKPTKL